MKIPRSLHILIEVVAVLVAFGIHAQSAAQQAEASPPSGNGGAKAVSTGPTGDASPWPRIVKAGNTTLSVYQPQPDTWDGFQLIARAAVGAMRDSAGGDASQTRYGVMTIAANTLTDKGRRIVTIEQAKVIKSEFPSATADEVRVWEDAVRRTLAGKSRVLALDQLEASLNVEQAQRPIEKMSLRNPVPQFIFSSVPAILVSVDGRPVYRSVKESSLERVINTRPLLLRDRQGTYYLKVFDGWMSAPALDAAWSVLPSPSAELAQAFRQASDAHLVDPLTGQGSADSPAPSLRNIVPAIYVATGPAELIVTDGAPRYVPIADTRLQYAENTTGNVFRSTDDNKTYVLVSGRWFRAEQEKGPWEYVASNALPDDFARIPDDSEKENVKASVAGTLQAREAAIAASVPQTAAVKIADTRLATPHFDGDPVFKPIAGTTMRYAANTSTPIIDVPGNTYYAVQNGVWFSAQAVAGPWSVATSVPAAIYTIPPESPLYYVTFVRIYRVENGVVYVGYTPGYQGTVIDPATGMVVYGTGYEYDPWVGTVWYGAPVTYGYAASVAYTPWTGWAVGFGFGWAWGATTAAAGWGWGAYPYWGVWAYPAWAAANGPRGGAVAWGPGGWAGYTGNIYTQWGNRATVTRAGGGYNAWTGNAWASRVGSSYNSRTGVASAGQRGAVSNVYTGNVAAGARGVAQGPGGNVVAGERGTIANPNTGQVISGGRGVVANSATGETVIYGRASGQGGTVVQAGNDVYAGKDGNIYRNTGAGWEQHTSSGWSPTSSGGGEEGSRVQQLDSERFARQSGDNRAQNLGRATHGMQFSFGGGRGGGGRGR